MIVTLTGTQYGASRHQLRALMKWLDVNYSSLTAIYHGGCVGFDSEAHLLLGALGLWEKTVIWPSTIRQKRGIYTLMPLQGAKTMAPEKPLVRNHLMVDWSDYVVAAPASATEQLRSGTWATIRYARKMKIPYRVLTP